MPDLLDHGSTGLEDRHCGGVVQAERGAVHVQDVASRFCLSALKHDPICLDPPRSPEPDHVLDLPQGLKLASA